MPEKPESASWSSYFDRVKPKLYKLKVDLSNLKKYESNEQKIGAKKMNNNRKE
ncbi:20563_t:CDS:2, partial [Racocetra persica]